MSKSASTKRENALSKIISRFDGRDQQEERFLNGYAHHTVPPICSMAMQLEEQLKSRVAKPEAIITEVACNCKGSCDHQKYVNQTITIPPIFELHYNIRGWVEKFYSQSTSIEAKALEIQKAVGEAGFSQAVQPGFQPWTDDDPDIEAD